MTDSLDFKFSGDSAGWMGGGGCGGCEKGMLGKEEAEILDLGQVVENRDSGFTTLREAFQEAYKKVKERFLQKGIKIEEQKTEGLPE